MCTDHFSIKCELWKMYLFGENVLLLFRMSQFLCIQAVYPPFDQLLMYHHYLHPLHSLISQCSFCKSALNLLSSTMISFRPSWHVTVASVTLAPFRHALFPWTFLETTPEDCMYEHMLFFLPRPYSASPLVSTPVSQNVTREKQIGRRGSRTCYFPC